MARITNFTTEHDGSRTTVIFTALPADNETITPDRYLGPESRREEVFPNLTYADAYDTKNGVEVEIELEDDNQGLSGTTRVLATIINTGDIDIPEAAELLEQHCGLGRNLGREILKDASRTLAKQMNPNHVER